MQKVYVLQGLCCANCASKIEQAVKAMEGVLSASVNLMNTSLTLDTDEVHAGNITARVEGVVHKYEPDVVVLEQGAAHARERGHSHEHGHEHDHGESGKEELLQLIIGGLIFAAAMLASAFLPLNHYVTASVFLAVYVLLGWEVLLRAVKNISRGQVFDENFLMSLATIGAIAIGSFAEAAAIMLFYQTGEYFQALAVRRSKRSITDLMDIRPDYANIVKDGELFKVSPETVAIGDIIAVLPGEKIPLDGVVVRGESSLDQAALTGESAPRDVVPGDTALSGCINQNGALTIKVSKTFGESTVSKIINLVENAGAKKAPTENFITTFARYYTPGVVALAALVALLPPLFFGGPWAQWIHRSLIFLVISCPCALVISIPLGFFGGIGGASRLGVLVKGGNYLEALNNLDIVVFDKTGTLSKGVFEVAGVYPKGGLSKDELLELAAHAEALSNHPIAQSIRKAYGKTPDKRLLENHRELAGHGVSVTVSGQPVLAGNAKLMRAEGISAEEIKEPGTVVYVAAGGQYAGRIVISDTIKPDSYGLVPALKKRGVRKTVMLTGDNAQVGEAVAEELGLDEAYTQLLPAEKVERLETLDAEKRPGKKLAFVGDGVNDAPVLARADVGIAMGGLGSDAAIEAADIVLMTDEPSKLLAAMDAAGKTRRVVWQNIVFALGVKGVVLLLGAFGLATMWEAVIADVGVSVLAILNSMRAMRVK